MGSKEVVIIGGGIAGINVAITLADAGFAVHIIEREAQLGGHAANFACKATEKCNKCLVCLADEDILKVYQHSKIKVWTGSKVVSFSGKPGDFEVRISQVIGKESPFKELTLKAGAIVIATGYAFFNAEEKKEYGYGKYKNVITAFDLERAFRVDGKIRRLTDGAIPKKIAFFQCVGSRDESIGRGYCSKVCCPYALRLSKLIKSEIPDSNITIFYMDIQPTGKDFSSLRKSCEEIGIKFARNLPSKVYGYSDSDVLRVKCLDNGTGEVVQREFDLVVLSVGMSPRDDAKFLADLFGIDQDEYGFYKGRDYFSNLSSLSGVFLAGACQGPKDIGESVVHGKAAAAEVIKMFASLR